MQLASGACPLVLMASRPRLAAMQRTGIRSAGNVRHISDGLWNSHFLRACRGEPSTRVPVWLMRQAGRYMRHYRELRAKHGFLELCKDPARATEVTIYAQTWLGVDAAIIFSDILVILESLGLPLEFGVGEGPRLNKPLRAPGDVDRLGEPRQAAADLDFLYRAVHLTSLGLPADVPLIGFCGAPFTLAAYAIEGGGSRQFARTKAFMFQHPEAWHRLMDKLVTALAACLTAQVQAGASVVQIFDSWIGALTRSDFREFVQPHLQRLISELPEGVPVILFGTGTGHLLDLLATCGSDVVGLDHLTDLNAGWRQVGGPERVAVQGNLDPALLLAPAERLKTSLAQLRGEVANQPGYIFNLGHGVLKETQQDSARLLVELVHSWTTSG